MPKVVYDKLNYHELVPTAMCLQLADQTVRYPAGIAENVPVKIRNFFIPVDFIVLDMESRRQDASHSGKAILEYRKGTH